MSPCFPMPPTSSPLCPAIGRGGGVRCRASAQIPGSVQRDRGFTFQPSGIESTLSQPGGRRDAAVGGPSSPYRIEESCPAPCKGRSISWRWPPVPAGGPSRHGTSRTSAPCSRLPGQEQGGGTSLNWPGNLIVSGHSPVSGSPRPWPPRLRHRAGRRAWRHRKGRARSIGGGTSARRTRPKHRSGRPARVLVFADSPRLCCID